MNPNWLGVISAILAFPAFSLVFRVARDRPLKTRILLSLVATLAAIPGASFAVYYAHILPEPAWYYQFRSIPGTELLVGLLGVAGGLVATLLPRVLLVLPLFGVAAFSIAPVIKPFFGPIPRGALLEAWEGDVCLQSTPSTCGAASTATILRHFGIAATESALAAEAHSYSAGTEAWYLARAARSRGCDVAFDLGPGFSPEGGLPAVVGVRLESRGHFIPILGQDGDRFIVGDPMRGPESLSRDQLQQRYEFTGFHMRFKNNRDTVRIAD